MGIDGKKRCWGCLFYICFILFVVFLIILIVNKNARFSAFLWTVCAGGLGVFSLNKLGKFTASQKNNKKDVNNSKINKQKSKKSNTKRNSFPPEISNLILKSRVLYRNGEHTRELEMIEDKLNKLRIYCFYPDISIHTPSKILEMAGLFAENRNAASEISSLLEGTLYERAFIVSDGMHIEDDLKEYLDLRKEAAKYMTFRKILEKENVSLNKKIENINKYLETHKNLLKNDMYCFSSINDDDRLKNELSYGDCLLIDRYKCLGLPGAKSLYLRGLRKKEDFLNTPVSEIGTVRGVKKEELANGYSCFVEKIKQMDNFDVNIWIDDYEKINFLTHSLKAYDSFKC